MPPFTLTTDQVSLLILGGEIPFLLLLFLTFRIASAFALLPPWRFQLITALSAALLSLLFAGACAWFGNYLEKFGPSEGTSTYQGNGALVILYTMMLGAGGAVIITLLSKAWWATIIAPVIVLVGPFVLARFVNP